MPVELFVDGAVATTLTSSPGIGATSFTVASSAGFPAASSAAVPPTQSRCLIGSEMVTVTNVAGTTWTVLPTTTAHSSGDAVGFELFAAHMQGLQYPQNPARPAVVDYETFSRNTGYLNAGYIPPSGTLALIAVGLPAGLRVGTIQFVSGGGAAATPTHWWFGLYDKNLMQLALTANQTSGAWAASTAKALPVASTAAGAATSFLTTYAGLYYLGIMMVAATPVTVLSGVVATSILALPPVVNGTSDTGQTTPPGFPHTAAAITATTNTVYATIGP